MEIRKEQEGYSLRSRTERMAVSAQELLEIAEFVAADKDQLDKEAAEEREIQQLQDARSAGKKDPDAKVHGGFVILRQPDGNYYYQIGGGLGTARLIEQWRWNPGRRTWQAF